MICSGVSDFCIVYDQFFVDVIFPWCEIRLGEIQWICVPVALAPLRLPRAAVLPLQNGSVACTELLELPSNNTF